MYYAKAMRTLQVFLMFAFVFFVFSNPAAAQSPSSLGESSAEILEDVTPTASPSPQVAKVNYDLPYPGMLPDNPLYFLKGIRDKIIEILISDPVKKGEFYLLSSDKRLNSGYYLIEKGKDEMGVLYISKSNNYMHMAVAELQKSGTRGKDMFSTLKTSIKKHEEVMQNSLKKVDKKYTTELTNEIERLKQIEVLTSSKK